MNETHSDAFVFFGATGDLAFKKIFPSLQAMARRGHLNVPVIGIGRSAPNLAALKDRARAGRSTLRVVVPADDGARLAAVYRAGEVLSREVTAEGVVLTVRMEGWRARQLSLTDGAA